jgi:hypothetical protein
MLPLQVLRITYSAPARLARSRRYRDQPMNTWRMIDSFAPWATSASHVHPFYRQPSGGRNGALHLLLAGQPRRMLFGQQHARRTHPAVAARCPTWAAVFAVQRVGRLDQQARPDHPSACRHSGDQVLQNLERLGRSRGFSPLMCATKPATGVVTWAGSYRPCCWRSLLSATVVMAGASFKLEMAKHSQVRKDSAQQNRQVDWW